MGRSSSPPRSCCRSPASSSTSTTSPKRGRARRSSASSRRDIGVGRRPGLTVAHPERTAQAGRSPGPAHPPLGPAWASPSRGQLRGVSSGDVDGLLGAAGGGVVAVGALVDPVGESSPGGWCGAEGVAAGAGQGGGGGGLPGAVDQALEVGLLAGVVGADGAGDGDGLAVADGAGGLAGGHLGADGDGHLGGVGGGVLVGAGEAGAVGGGRRGRGCEVEGAVGAGGGGAALGDGGGAGEGKVGGLGAGGGCQGAGGGGVPVAGEVVAGWWVGGEVVVVAAVQERLVLGWAGGGHGDGAAGVVVVAHDVGFVGAVAGGAVVGSVGLDGAEGVEDLVELGVVPAGRVHACVHRSGVVPVVGGGSLVVVDLAEAADAGGGVDPDQVFAVGAVVAEGLELGAHHVEAGFAGGGQQHAGDVELAALVGDEPEVAAAAGLGGAEPGGLVELGCPLAEAGEQAGVAVGDQGAAGVDHLDAVAEGAVADAGHRRRRGGVGGGGGLLQGGQAAEPGAWAVEGGACLELFQGGAVVEADAGGWGVVAVWLRSGGWGGGGQDRRGHAGRQHGRADGPRQSSMLWWHPPSSRRLPATTAGRLWRLDRRVGRMP